jgi:hypothetical protein
LYADGVRAVLGVPHEDGPDPQIAPWPASRAAASFPGLELELR